METSLLVKTIVILTIVFSILVVALVLNSRSKKRKKEEAEKKEAKKKEKKKDPYLSITDLYKVIKKRTSTADELKKALEMIIEYHGKINQGSGSKTTKDMDVYNAIMFTLCRHPNTNKDLILYFDRELEKRNPEYIKEINEALEKGLNSRGA